MGALPPLPPVPLGPGQILEIKVDDLGNPIIGMGKRKITRIEDTRIYKSKYTPIDKRKTLIEIKEDEKEKDNNL